MNRKKPSSADSPNAREAILVAATSAAQAHGYAGLNIRTLADVVGVKHASLYYHFASKAELAAAVAKRYWEDTTAVLETMAAEAGDHPSRALRKYPNIFRKSLENDNRLCLCSFMSAEYDDLPDPVKAEVQAFADVNVAWLARMLQATGLAKKASQQRALSIYAAVAGAQLMARSRADLGLFDALIEGYRGAGLLPV